MENSFSSLYDEIKKVIGDGKITTARLIILTPRMVRFIQEVGTVNKMSGQEKKELLLSIINKIIDESKDLNDEERESIKLFVEVSLPLVIDSVVYAYKSEAFKEIKKKAKKCVKGCMN